MLGCSSEFHEVLEVRQPVLGRHVEQQRGVVRLPRKIRGDVVGRDREGEHPALGIAGRHDLDVGAVDHVHLGLQFAIGERHLLAGDDRNLLLQVVRAGPVEGQVGEGRLRAPARGHVEVVDQFLDVLAHFLVTHAVLAHEGRHVGIEGREGLRPRPFVLHGAEEIHDLPHRARHVPRRPGLDLARHAVQAFVQQRAQRPAGAVAGQHVEVVDVDVALAVRGAGLGRIDVRQPVVGGDLAGDVEDQPAERIALVGVGIDPPVGAGEVFVDRAFDIDLHLALAAQRRVPFAVDDVGARGGGEAVGDQRFLDHVLDLLDADRLIAEAMGEHAQHPFGETDRFVVAVFAAGPARTAQRGTDLAGIESGATAVALDHLACAERAGGFGRVLHFRPLDALNVVEFFIQTTIC